MIAGFEAINDKGAYQVDSGFPVLALVRSGQLLSQTYTNGETTNTSPTRVAVTVNDGEILAVSSGVFSSLGSTVGNVAYIYTDGPAGQLVNYYIFRPGEIPASTVGLQLFNDLGRLTFDSGWDLFDVRAIMTGYDTLSLAPGRKYAFVHNQIATRVKYIKVVNGMPPNYMTSYIRTTEFSSYKINSNVIEARLSTIDIAGTRPKASGSSSGFTSTQQNGVVASALIIDVTGM
ncbi:hypothetical protein C4K03_1374 [Pseudomonas synxantha]|uniref:Uncharacterized protein n=1 Tax=Pseudomonas synxantha TaxID=47883 RepID=A0A3G7U2E5_9PSED|nr:hypothetical protein [Pseudomonas synxantha]AZE53545.1 hypothetical protein C4K03_1374 [Pseudomonas synxantha]